jgi:hypothetical protein
MQVRVKTMVGKCMLFGANCGWVYQITVNGEQIALGIGYATKEKAEAAASRENLRLISRGILGQADPEPEPEPEPETKQEAIHVVKH